MYILCVEVLSVALLHQIRLQMVSQGQLWPVRCYLPNRVVPLVLLFCGKEAHLIVCVCVVVYTWLLVHRWS